MFEGIEVFHEMVISNVIAWPKMERVCQRFDLFEANKPGPGRAVVFSSAYEIVNNLKRGAEAGKGRQEWRQVFLESKLLPAWCSRAVYAGE
ncbi:MAG: hypothetical protein HYR56_20205 [Acidobacteria bacterium]|nr:hypothetical protein [Acidobacteriota bacterium]